jgi:hypothetical protein
MGDTVHLPQPGGRTLRAQITGTVFYDPAGEKLHA